MRRVALVPCHYGRDHLAWAVRGVQEAADEVHVFYSAEPSFGHAAPGARCPDTEAELEAEARRFARVPVLWHRVRAGSEGEHRGLMYAEAARRGARTVFQVDADEVWAPGDALRAAEHAEAEDRAGRWLCRFTHTFRSWRWRVEEPFRPVRVLDLRHTLDRDAYMPDGVCGPVIHHGYAQRLEVVRYKWTCHGHRSELRPGWLERYEAWRPGDRDMHPTVPGLWDPTPTPPEELARVLAAMGDHPHAHLELIP